MRTRIRNILATYLKLSPGEARPHAAGWCGDSRLTIGFIQAPIASSVASARYSATVGTLPRPGGGTAIGRSDHRQLTITGRGRAEQFRPATGSQDPARPHIADPWRRSPASPSSSKPADSSRSPCKDLTACRRNPTTSMTHLRGPAVPVPWKRGARSMRMPTTMHDRK
jgi:hypothetical protein